VAGSDDMPGREDGAAADVLPLYDVVDGDHKGKLVFAENYQKIQSNSAISNSVITNSRL
jgi:hypothetical protein